MSRFGSLLLILTWLFGSISQGIIIRHDVAPDDYVLNPNEFPQVFFIERQGRSHVCAATLIDSHWALTAAHCVNETSLAETIASGQEFAVEISNRRYAIDLFVMHPDYLSNVRPEVDLALLRFKDGIAAPQPIPINELTSELGEVITIVGWGYFGLGTTGRQYDDGEKRWAHNRVTQADQRLRSFFDDPRKIDNSVLPLEGTLGLGDSGGPALMKTQDGIIVVGVAIGEIEGEGYSEETQGKYGSTAIFERISIHADWIKSIIYLDK